MNIVKPDELHRLVKLAMDTGEAESIEHAQRIFSRYRIGVAVGFEIGRSNTHQAALLTFLRLASRVFLGGVDVLIPDEAAIPNLLPGNQGIAEAILAAGARRVKLLEPNVPSVYIGTIEPPQSASFAVRAVFNGWRAGIVPVHADVPFDLDSEFPLSGALAAALAVNEAFLFVRQDTPEAGLREIGLSLWKPDAVEDWWQAENDGPRLTYLPSKLWFIGLGHLGQAYLWGLSLLPYANPEEVELILHDIDVVTASTLSTSILSERPMMDKRKTRAMAAVMEARGFRTAIVERKFDKTLRVQPDEPQVALCGVDNVLARRALCDVGFKFIVEAGIGSGVKDFRAIRIHTFPGTKDPHELWKPGGEKVVESSAPAYGDLKARGLDQCGVTLLAGKAVGAPFVGMTAAVLCLAEVLRLLHEGTLFAVHDLDLKSLSYRASIEHKGGLATFNPGFVSVPDRGTRHTNYVCR
ncbi:MAG: hypothetical protein MPW14_10885 [Candidatus Manganitrophus sp.]|nr:hypothetical protein [Candidatus Manganitrophus sp.]WDT70565.1 MAG: hypothetical protein MPW17_17695 [Candidatus Manganitrophus sp.]WDT82181.1 MAG: hypothetical protein MPW14_10885 [Candidatus Manganitrophus sp.]